MTTMPKIKSMILFVAFFGGAASASFFGNDNCPVVEPVDDFDVDEYVSKSWYIQKQQPNSYQSLDRLFCVVATYDTGGRQWLQSAIKVSNYANVGGVNGERTSAQLCATSRAPPTNKDLASLAVAPCFLPPVFGGPYWVVAVGSGYRWAIVSGGEPDQESDSCGDGLCSTRVDQPGLFLRTLRFFNRDAGEGLWFFSRDQVASDEIIQEMEQAAAALGYCTSQMVDVIQEGCNYEGATLKS